MKVLLGLLWVSSTLNAYLVAAQALIYTSDTAPLPPKAEPQSISPSTARLLFAQRLGLSQYHSLEDADESLLDFLNTHGGHRQQIFQTHEQKHDSENVLIIVDGVSRPEDIFGHSISAAAVVNPQPSNLQNIRLATDLLSQDRYRRFGRKDECMLDFPLSYSIRGGLSSSSRSAKQACDEGRGLAPKDSKTTLKEQIMIFKQLCKNARGGSDGQTTILHISSLEGLNPKDGAKYTAALSNVKDLISYFHSPSPHRLSTIVLMPATSAPTKRSTTSPYGAYADPRREEPEEPLVSPDSAPTFDRPSAPEIQPFQASTTPLPRGIIPACHPDLESAISATNNCSGHGTAYKKSSGEKDCYACRCSKTVLTDDQGKVKTVYWGGPACQKKDISVQFFLLAGLTIALVAATTWGIGLLMSIGEEDLPSVIGAGVSGPRAQK